MHSRLLRAFAAFVALSGALLLTAISSRAQFGQPAKVPVSLVSEATVVAAGQPFTVALRLQHPVGVHTYWINPGIGQATKIDWKLPDGWKAGPLTWPIPKVYDSGAGPSNIYKGDTFLLAEITPSDAFKPGDQATLAGKATWFECTEVNCIRATGEVSLKVTAGASTEFDAAMKARFDAVRAQQPRETEAWSVQTAATDDAVTLTLTRGNGASEDPGDIHFFESANTVELGAPKVEKTAAGYVVTVVRTKPDRTPAGFLHASNGWLADGSLPALAIAFSGSVDAPAAEGAATSTPPAGQESPQATDHGEAGTALSPATLAALDAIIPKTGPKFVDLSGAEKREPTFVWALLLAALGGLILNAMPCVFPVLGLKVLGFVQQSGEDAGKVRLHGLVFTLGLLVAMWVLAGVLIALNAGGQRLGWGFQQQSPGFLAFIIALLFLLGLNLAGVFEWGAGFTGLGGSLMERQGFAGSFFTGVLTTLVATPCSGPFLGAAMGFALRQPAGLALVLFTSFGLGIALPYLILSMFPKLVDYLPRPGAWMETFKVAMAFPMLATVIYFLLPFSAQTGRVGMTWLLVALLLLALAAWIYGRWSAPHRSASARRGGLVAAALVVAAAVMTARNATKTVPESREMEERLAQLSEQLEHAVRTGGKLPEDESATAGAGGVVWEKWSPERVAELRRQGKVIFVDFTAEWCATCQVNKRVVFKSPGSDQVAAAFARAGAVALKADWTDEDPVISEFLFRNGLFAIPVNFVYPADASKPPIMLPEGFLTQGHVIEGLGKAG